ncbi:DUF5605 domain-containing protein [Nocardioides sp. WG-D5]
MRTITSQTPFTAVLANAEAVTVVKELAPEVLDSPLLEPLSAAPTGPFLTLVLGEKDPRSTGLLDRLARFADTTPQAAQEDPVLPRPDYEDAAVPKASAIVTVPTGSKQNQRAELVISGPAHGNPFVDVELGATFSRGEQTFAVGGFYDGAGRYRIRFLPPVAGEWTFTTTSNARSLDGLHGALSVAPSNAPGPVRVADTYHFAHVDGSPYVPFGTTAYAWIHQNDELQDATVAQLRQAPFNKLRMCLFPKDYLYNTNEPDHFVFERAADGEWDTTRFDLDFFANLERRLEQLEELSIQADLILFHPYDRWGFSTLSNAADERYLTYIVRRLAAYPHVWWSMANEYELLAKSLEDWDRLAELVQREDHVGHLISIHNWVQIFDYTTRWTSHASLQRGDYGIGKEIDAWRKAWRKPVLIDEFGYEGDLEYGWGNLLAQEVVRRFWEGTLRGGYLTHGETYYEEKDLIWWSKGGALHGDSPARIAFLREIVAASPVARIDPLTSSFDDIRGGVDGEYVLIYFGASRPRFRHVSIPQGMVAQIDVIDTWDMTVTPVAGNHTGTVRVELPAKPYITIRLQRTHESV